jgi:hypothetical protein
MRQAGLSSRVAIVRDWDELLNSCEGSAARLRIHIVCVCITVGQHHYGRYANHHGPRLRLDEVFIVAKTKLLFAIGG